VRTSTPTSTPRPASTPTPTPTAGSTGSGAVTASGSVASGSGPYWAEEDVALSNTAPITALQVTLTVQKTAGVSFAGQYTNFAGGAITQSHADNGTTLVYSYTLNAGQTIGVGSGWKLGAQFSGNGSPHATSGDTFSLTATAGGSTTTLSGHF
jgi:hypothetical protein